MNAKFCNCHRRIHRRCNRIPSIPLQVGESTPGRVVLSPGGVARNIAENVRRLGIGVSFITALGEDMFGRNMLNQCRDIGIDLQHSILHDKKPTSFYLLITNTEGNPELAVADTSIISEITSIYLVFVRKCVNI